MRRYKVIFEIYERVDDRRELEVEVEAGSKKNAVVRAYMKGNELKIFPENCFKNIKSVEEVIA